MATAVDLPGYYRILPDNRDLNYAKYYTDGEAELSAGTDYNSHNTERLDVEQVKEKLLELDYIKNMLGK